MPEPEDHHRFYEAVYSQDNPKGEAHAWVQWKGTEVCMDVFCACGHQGHVDAGFAYFVRCPACGAQYAVGLNVKLIPLTAEQADYAGQDRFIEWERDE